MAEAASEQPAAPHADDDSDVGVGMVGTGDATPSQPEAQAAGAPAMEYSPATRDRLIAFYQHYNPAQLSHVDAILDAYAGDEQEMFEATWAGQLQLRTHGERQVVSLLKQARVAYGPTGAMTADEIWLTSSTREIAPVIKLDNRAVGNGVAGEYWKKIIALYQDYKQELRHG